ncbi:nuclear transport factor 2 family protein [Croceicoccus sediminis]|uniref:nuclear transport factor 2 family protein n=1 Tax=Croceicoccus sediminis TaxID=2571150 RepID=UPI001183ECCF|nr:nuclear transport factor 2 family protein [Croceicoccus sediminis]
MDAASVRELARRFFDCIEQGDIEGFAACYAPDVEIWHNTDGETQNLEANRVGITGMVSRIADRVYDDRRVEVFPGGFVQQHVLRGTRVHDGARLNMPACVVCAVADGRITRVDEYFDSAQLAEFRKGV